jgi:hypothetical protein
MSQKNAAMHPQTKGKPMNAKSKNTLKAAAMAAGLVAVLLPTGCSSMTGGGGAGTQPEGQQAPGSPDTVVAPPTVD